MKDMKLLLALWILALVTKEVFPSTLVRLPRQALSKPTSSVHTEYEATYEQKGKLGNGSFSTVSGKQEVVHNNCGDNWNAFADKCASLIKDLVASLANAVSSKPGDATNLQLRIKNTLTHFDSTDNCTCLNHTKNGLSGVDLSSLFDNITINTVQPASNNGNNAITPVQQTHGANGDCQGDCHGRKDGRDNAANGIPKAVAQPNLRSTNNENVDPELVDASDELSGRNNRRGAQYPQISRNNVRAPENSIGRNNQQSPAAANQKKILRPAKVAPARAVETPAEVVAPQSQPTNSAASSPNTADPVVLPTTNDFAERPAVLVKPATAPSSASQVSSPPSDVIGTPVPVTNAGPASGSGSGRNQNAQAPVVPVTPIRNTVPKNGGGSSGNGVGPTKAIPVDKPVVIGDDAVAQPLTSSNNDDGSPLLNGDGLNEAPVVAPVVTDSQTTPRDSDEGDDSETNNGTPVVVPVDNGDSEDSKTTPDDNDDDSSEGNNSGRNVTPIVAVTPVVPVAGGDDEAVAEPLTSSNGGGSSGNGGGLDKTPVDVPVVASSDYQTTPKDDDDDDDDDEGSSEEKKNERKNTPVVSTGDSDDGDSKNDTDESDEDRRATTPIAIVPPVIAPAAPETDDGGNGSGVGPDAESSLQDRGASDGSGDDAADQDPSVVVPVKPVDSPTREDRLSGTSKTVGPTQDDSDSGSDDAKVIPGPVARQPQDGRTTQSKPSPEVLPITNSNSNLPDSSAPVDRVTTVNRSPVYVPSPTVPSPVPSNQNLEPSSDDDEQPVTPSIPTTTEFDEAPEQNENVPLEKPVPVVPVASPTKGNNGRKGNENIFIVTPVPVYHDKTDSDAVVPGTESGTGSDDGDDITVVPTQVGVVPGNAKQGNQPSDAPEVVVNDRQTGDDQGLLTTPLPVQVVPVTELPNGKSSLGTGDQTRPLTTQSNNQQTPVAAVPVVTEGKTRPDNQGTDDSSSPDVNSGSNSGGDTSGGSQTGSPATPAVVEPAIPAAPDADVPEDGDLTKPTTFQTTSTDPTPPQQSIQSPPAKTSTLVTRPTSTGPQDSYETVHAVPATSPKTPVTKHGDDDDDDDEEDCCESCESCTEEEIANPRQYKEIACKDLEDARRELKAIFDKIKKKLKCGRKAPQKIVAS